MIANLPKGSLNESCDLKGSNAPIPPGKFGGRRGLGPNPNGAKGPPCPAKQSK